jgi:thiol-disulfide isomerase/thioredoxin
MKTKNTCILIHDEEELNKVLKTEDNIFILFYAPWCPFSQRFLPIFEKCAQDTSKQCYRMIIDDLPELCEKYLIEIYPTVLFFTKGKPVKRLDGSHGIGLNEQQFQELIKKCEYSQ